MEVQTNLRVDDELIVRYKVAAARNKTSMAELIRRALAKGIKEFEK